MMEYRDSFESYTFSDIEFIVPERYKDLNPMGGGAQGVVW